MDHSQQLGWNQEQPYSENYKKSFSLILECCSLDTNPGQRFGDHFPFSYTKLDDAYEYVGKSVCVTPTATIKDITLKKEYIKNDRVISHVWNEKVNKTSEMLITKISFGIQMFMYQPAVFQGMVLINFLPDVLWTFQRHLMHVYSEVCPVILCVCKCAQDGTYFLLDKNGPLPR